MAARSLWTVSLRSMGRASSGSNKLPAWHSPWRPSEVRTTVRKGHLTASCGRSFSSSTSRGGPHDGGASTVENDSRTDSSETDFPSYHRVWTADNKTEVWTQRLVDREDEDELLRKIEDQELDGGRLKARQLGVLHEDPATDMEQLTENYTATSLASALRDREEALQQASVLAARGDVEELQQFLKIFHPKLILERRVRRRPLKIMETLDQHALEWIRKKLMRMPRNVVSAHAKRAGVVIALCTVNGVPCVMLEKRSPHLRAHPDEVCLPGGMVCEIADDTIVATCLREMREEVGGLPEIVNVLGFFRCNWGDVHHLVGMAVTPVVCFLGELPERLHPNPDEVSQVFTVSLQSLAEPSYWSHKEGLAPMFLGGPHAIWGLTGYILDRFRKDLLRPNRVTLSREV
jgi:8-oxo-dGTP pyrophosphatase MutT (NUDIX family)